MSGALLRIHMHEISVALNILEIVEKQCRDEGYRKVESVRVRVGKAAGILAEALAFAFESVKRGTIAQNADLIIDSIPLGGICHRCRAEFETEEPIVVECPICASPSFKINQGYELQIVEMDVNR